MTHWLDKIVEIMKAETADLRELARIAGYDPTDFYRGTVIDGADLCGQDLTGMEFTHLDLSKVKYDENTRFPSSLSLSLKIESFRDFGAAPHMIVVPAGEFMMGSPSDSAAEERPQHKVTIKNSFAVSVAPVTRGEFAAFSDASGRIHDKSRRDPGYQSWRDPGFQQGDDHPVVYVSWGDAQAYVKWLTERSGGKAYRLLSEAEWEYCCRAGTTTEYSTGDTITPTQANFMYSNGTTPVSKFPPNRWGLRDMHGNVWEWCEDTWRENYRDNPPTDGSAWRPPEDRPHRGYPPTDGWVRPPPEPHRVLRGGSWNGHRHTLRSTSRRGDDPGNRIYDVGFRVAKTL
jgi:formylglycine-generating enzyme required for sulfatase activity